MSPDKKVLIPDDKNKSFIDIDDIQKRALAILKDVKKVLDEYKLTYWLEDGAVLGIIRDKKLIPWDDEIDLGTYKNNFPSVTDFCEKLNKKGYITKFALDRIKVMDKDWKVGYFKIDLHLWHLANQHYTCPHPEEGKKFFSVFSRNLERVSRLFSCFDYKNRVEYYRFKDIAQMLLLHNVNPKDWKNIEFFRGPYNRRESFILKNPEVYIVSDPLGYFIKSMFVRSMIEWLFKLLPKAFIGKLHTILDNLNMSYKRKITAYGVLKVPRDYFENLSAINFYGIKIKIPKKSEGYLRLVYGDSWRVPNAGWKREDMGIISMKHKTKDLKIS